MNPVIHRDVSGCAQPARENTAGIALVHVRGPDENTQLNRMIEAVVWLTKPLAQGFGVGDIDSEAAGVVLATISEATALDCT